MNSHTQTVIFRRRMPWSPWVPFFALIATAWAGLFVLAAGHGDASSLGPGAEWADPLVAMLGVEWHAHGLHTDPMLLAAMWGLMCVAMMAPTATPLLRSYRHLSEGNPERIHALGFWSLLAGYVVVWLGYSVLAAIAQWWLAGLALLSSAGLSTSAWLSTGLLAVAGAYQFSRLKHSCLTQCRSPMAFLLGHWREGIRGAFHMGMLHGATCVGCCWALMALSFVGGTMNLLWMGGAMILMILEKLPAGRRLTAPVGIVLLASAAIVAVTALH